MAFDAYIQIDGIPGEVLDDKQGLDRSARL